jgi:hypothetical protein
MNPLQNKVILFVFIILSLGGTSCSYKEEGTRIHEVATDEMIKTKDQYIVVESPMTLSNNSIHLGNEKYGYLRLKMIKGRYYEDWTPGAHMGTNWEGEFVLEVSDDSGNTIYETSLNAFYPPQTILNYHFTFEITFDDYNDDGHIDFTIGQYASSNGNEYKLFTIDADGKIKALEVDGYPTLFISKGAGFYSTELIKVDKLTFKKEYYDNVQGKELEEYFQWNGNKFVHIEK